MTRALKEDITWQKMDDDNGQLTILVDLGTTSIVLTLVDNTTGQILDSRSAINPQRQWGMEVMSRITAVQRDESNLKKMQSAVINVIAELSGQMCSDLTQINKVFVAGNAVMNHLLLGKSPVSLGQYPYELVFQNSQQISFTEIGLELFGKGSLISLPNISAFIGGDIVAGILAAGIHKPGPTRLFIDVGTNGELVLTYGNQYFATSCAAGPALEGMNIACGMLADPGAISEAEFKEGSIHLETIDNAPAQGICGSGILALVREALKVGLIDFRGRLQNQPDYEQYIDLEQKRIWLDREMSLFISQKDIRQIQLAKGAIRSAIECLLIKAELNLEQVDQVLVSGQFGSYIQPDSFVVLGMLPSPWKDRIHYLGNAALNGCWAFAASPQLSEEANDLAQNIKHFDLSGFEPFQRIFAQALLFPKGDSND